MIDHLVGRLKGETAVPSGSEGGIFLAKGWLGLDAELLWAFARTGVAEEVVSGAVRVEPFGKKPGVSRALQATK